MTPHAHRRGKGAPALPLSLIVQAIPKLSRHELASVTERLIERLDELDGDPDLEEDDPSGQCDEDGMNTLEVQAQYSINGPSYSAPGCPISDPDDDSSPC